MSPWPHSPAYSNGHVHRGACPPAARTHTRTHTQGRCRQACWGPRLGEGSEVTLAADGSSGSRKWRGREEC